MSLVFLKVKIKSLAEEARIIRAEEVKRIYRGRVKVDGNEVIRQRLPLEYGDTYFALRSHRTWDVRNEARAAQLAYALLRGRSYRQVEPESKNREKLREQRLDVQRMVPRIADLVFKYGQGPTTKEAVRTAVSLWIENQNAYAKIAA